MRCVIVPVLHTLYRLCADEHHQHRRNQPSPFAMYLAHFSSVWPYVKYLVPSQPGAVQSNAGFDLGLMATTFGI